MARRTPRPDPAALLAAVEAAATPEAWDAARAAIRHSGLSGRAVDALLPAVVRKRAQLGIDPNDVVVWRERGALYCGIRHPGGATSPGGAASGPQQQAASAARR